MSHSCPRSGDIIDLVCLLGASLLDPVVAWLSPWDVGDGHLISDEFRRGDWPDVDLGERVDWVQGVRTDSAGGERDAFRVGSLNVLNV